MTGLPILDTTIKLLWEILDFKSVLDLPFEMVFFEATFVRLAAEIEC